MLRVIHHFTNTEQRASSVIDIWSFINLETSHHCFEIVFRSQAGIEQIFVRSVPLPQTAIIEHSQFVVDNEWYYIIRQ